MTGNGFAVAVPKKKVDLRLPKEHGAWAMLYAPLVIGIIVVGRLNLAVVLLCLSVSFFFISRTSVMFWWRARRLGRGPGNAGRVALVYLANAAFGGLILLVVYQLWWLLPKAALGAGLLLINAEQGVKLRDRSIAGELMAIAGLTLAAPAAHYAASGELTATAGWLWLLNALFFASSVFYIRLRVYGVSPRKAGSRKRLRLLCLLYHCAVAALLVLLLLLKANLSWFLFAAFVPIIVRTIWYFLRPATTLSLRRIGVLEIVYSVVFIVFLSLTFSGWH